MNIEANLIISILKLTKNDPVSSGIVTKDARIPSSLALNFLRKLKKDGLIYFQDRTIKVDSLKRLKLAVRAIQSGADLERVVDLLEWKEFERIASVAFERMGYSVKNNLRFKHSGRMWETDIVACRRPLVMCVDCKHWRHGIYPSAIKRIVKNQVERTIALTESLPRLIDRIGCTSWRRVKFVPAVLTLVTPRSRFCDDVPIISVLQLRDFLCQLPAYVHSLRHFSIVNLAY